MSGRASTLPPRRPAPPQLSSSLPTSLLGATPRKASSRQSGYFPPVEFRGVQEHTQPIPEGARCARRWLEESFRFGGNHFLLSARSHREPQRHPAIAAVVVMVVAERPFILNEEARGTVAQSLIHLGQREGILRTPSSSRLPHRSIRFHQEPSKQSVAVTLDLHSMST